MNKAGVVAMLVGAIIVCSRGILVLAPAASLRWLGQMIKTETRTRLLGAFVVLIAVPMIGSGIIEDSGLASVLFIFGVFIVLVTIPALLLFPRIYMALVDSLLPDSDGNLFGWRMVGLVGVVIGVALFRAGMVAL